MDDSAVKSTCSCRAPGPGASVLMVAGSHWELQFHGIKDPVLTSAGIMHAHPSHTGQTLTRKINRLYWREGLK